MSDLWLNGYSAPKAQMPRPSEVFTMQQPGATGSGMAKNGGKSVGANSGATAGSMKGKTGQAYRTPASRAGQQQAAKTPVQPAPAGAKMDNPAPAADNGTMVSQEPTGRGYGHKNPGDVQKSYAHSTWHPAWLEDAESNFKLVKFRFRRHGPHSQMYEVCQAYALRQSMSHTTESCVRYQLNSGGGNDDQISVGRKSHFPLITGGKVDEVGKFGFKNPLYNDMLSKYQGMVEYGEIVPKSINIYSSGMVVPQEVTVSSCSIIGGSKTDVCGISITGLSDIFHVKKCYDAGKSDKSYNAIVTSHSPVGKTVYQYYPMDHVAHYETMYGPVGKDNFDNSFKSNVSGGSVPLEVTSPVMLYMLCNIGPLFTRYLKKKKPTEWETHIDENLNRFFKSNQRPPIFDDSDSELDDEVLTTILDNIFDQRPSRETKSYPPWTFNLEGEEILFYIPQAFKDVLEEMYFEIERKDTFERDKFDVVVSDLNSSGTSNTTVNLILDVAVFTPVCFSYIRNVNVA